MLDLVVLVVSVRGFVAGLTIDVDLRICCLVGWLLLAALFVALLGCSDC